MLGLHVLVNMKRVLIEIHTLDDNEEEDKSGRRRT